MTREFNTITVDVSGERFIWSWPYGVCPRPLNRTLYNWAFGTEVSLPLDLAEKIMSDMERIFDREKMEGIIDDTTD